MFFLLKCAFWLALVYAAMLYGFGPVRPVSSDDVVSRPVSRQTAGDVARAGQAAVQAALGGATGGVTALCAHRPTDCLAEAARLKALFDASGAVEPLLVEHPPKSRRSDPKTMPLAGGDVRHVSTSVPMPVADPRRQGRVSRLTSRL